MSGTRSVKIDFFCVTFRGRRIHNEFTKIIEAASAAGGISNAICVPGSDVRDKHQLKSVKKIGAEIYRGIFGRCRYERLTQGDEKGAEADVELKPGHGLVEKNQFLFFEETNLLVYVRNPNGSPHSKLQSYLNEAGGVGPRFIFEPILQPSSYKRLLEGGPLRRVELSFALPKEAQQYEDFISPAVAKLVNEAGAYQGYIRLSVGHRKAGLAPMWKELLHFASRSGFATVARAKVEDISEPIDLVAERLVESVEVRVGVDGKVTDDEYFSALDTAKSSPSAQGALKAFYG